MYRKLFLDLYRDRLIVRYNKLPSVCYYTHLPFPHYLQIETNSFNHIAQSLVKNYSATTLLLFIAELLQFYREWENDSL